MKGYNLVNYWLDVNDKLCFVNKSLEFEPDIIKLLKKDNSWFFNRYEYSINNRTQKIIT